MQALRQVTQSLLQGRPYQRLLRASLSLGQRVRRRCRHQIPLWLLGLSNSRPDAALDGQPGVGGKGEAPCWVVVQDSLPQGNAPFLDELSVGQGATVLLMDYCVDQPLMGAVAPMSRASVAWEPLRKS